MKNQNKLLLISLSLLGLNTFTSQQPPSIQEAFFSDILRTIQQNNPNMPLHEQISLANNLVNQQFIERESGQRRSRE